MIDPFRLLGRDKCNEISAYDEDKDGKKRKGERTLKTLLKACKNTV